MLILGAGWVGDALRARCPHAAFTRRSARPGATEFDLAREETWTSLPADDEVVWTFPAAPPERAIALFESRFASSKVVVLGSTSAYLSSGPDELVDESAPLDLAQPRVAGEEALRARGAAVLHLAGLWGPGRDPVKWLLEGRVRNGLRFVNLVHLDDVLASIAAALAKFEPGLRVNVSDGRPRRWNEHVAELHARGGLPAGFALEQAPLGFKSKRIASTRLERLLPGHRFRRFPG